MVARYAFNIKSVIIAISLSLCVSSCSTSSSVELDKISEGPYILLVYPLTINSGIEGLGQNRKSACLWVGCGDLILIDNDGNVNRMEIGGMIDERVSFSEDGNRVVYSDEGGIVDIDNGKVGRIKVSGSSPVARYISVDNDGNMLYVNHQPIGGDSEEFSSLIYSKLGEVGSVHSESIDASFYECSGALYGFSIGEVDESRKFQRYPEFHYNRNGKFEKIRSGDRVSRNILGLNCNLDGSFDYIANVAGDIVIGRYDVEYGFKDGDLKYGWDEFASPRDEQPIIDEEDSVWALNALGEMRVFDKKSTNYRIVWDMYSYFEKLSVSEIGAISIQKGGSVFFFGIPKGKDKGWVMLEVGVKSGEIIRSVFLPSFDEHYPKGKVQDIYMGDVDGFRKWADTQPKFDYTAMN